MTKKFEIVKKGYWLYDNDIKKPISILKQNWDFYYEEGYENEPPDLNSDGEAYYVIFDNFSDLRYANRSQTCFSEKEAIALAENKVTGKISWE